MSPQEKPKVDFTIKPVILGLEEDTRVVKEKKTILSLNADTCGVITMVNGEERGVVFFGSGDYFVNSRINTSVGIFSKQYVDSFKDWGLIVGKVEKWVDARRQFTKTENTPIGFSDRADFIDKAEKNLYKMTSDLDTRRSIEKADWFYEVKGQKDKATLYCTGEIMAFKGCHAGLAATDEAKVALVEGKVTLALHGDRIAIVYADKRMPGETYVHVEVAGLSLLPKALEELGYKLE